MTQTLTATADTYVDSSAPATAFGTRPPSAPTRRPTRYVFLRFDLTAVTGTITAATLRLHAQDNTNAPSPAGGTVRSITNNSWSEASTTFNNRPSTSGTTVGSFGAVTRNTWNQMNVLAVVGPGRCPQPVDHVVQHRWRLLRRTRERRQRTAAGADHHDTRSATTDGHGHRDPDRRHLRRGRHGRGDELRRRHVDHRRQLADAPGAAALRPWLGRRPSVRRSCGCTLRTTRTARVRRRDGHAGHRQLGRDHHELQQPAGARRMRSHRSARSRRTSGSSST